MTHAEISMILANGAMIRLPSGKVRVWVGPFGFSENYKNEVFSIGYMDFYGSSFVACLAEKPVIETDASVFRRILIEFLEKNPGEKSLARSSFSEPSQEKFLQSYQVIQGKIHRGEIEKAVPVVFAQSPQRPNQWDLAHMLIQVLEAPAQLYPFGFWNEKGGILGATPEVLFHQKGDLIKTMALAGTLPKNKNANGDSLLKDSKELKEHKIVIEDIRGQLEKLGWVKVGETAVIEYPNLFHLKTEIEVENKNIEPAELVKRMHPTAALGVAPRNYGLQWMTSLPYQAERGIFGGPVVFSLSHSENLGLVAIRSLIWDERGSKVGSGCGLVEDSDFQKEWSELSTKRDFTFKMLGLLP